MSIFTHLRILIPSVKLCAESFIIEESGRIDVEKGTGAISWALAKMGNDIRGFVCLTVKAPGPHTKIQVAVANEGIALRDFFIEFGDPNERSNGSGGSSRICFLEVRYDSAEFLDFDFWFDGCGTNQWEMDRCWICPGFEWDGANRGFNDNV